MLLQNFAWLVDENLPSKIVDFLREQKIDVKSVREENLFGVSDIYLIQLAFIENRIIVTQDSDFGTIIHQREISFTGIIYLRPGHFESSFHIQTLQHLFNQINEIKSPFIIVAENKPEIVKIRVRQF
ncbi:MAG: DUF5615 family PIN-like protein [Microscillaceae bacterium]|nr:DUF5615 family PIN-like protein [Microscillaceae bacterium]